MANLFNIIKSSPSQLQQQSQEETQQLAKKTGQIVPPTTPSMAANIGANPDQAKMAGVQPPAPPKLGAAQMGQQSERQVQRTATGQRGLTEQEQQKQALAANLSGLRFLGQGVQNQFNSMLNNATAATGAINLTPSKALLSSIPQFASVAPEHQSDLENLITKIGTGSSTPADMLALARLTGMQKQQDLDNLLDNVKKSYVEKEKQAGTLTAQAVQDRIRFSDVDRTAMEQSGLNIEQLAAESGMEPADLLALTPQELSARVSQVAETRFQRTQALKDIINDPDSPPDLKSTALEGLKELGVSGISIYERKAAQAAADVAAAGVVTNPLTGEEQSIEDALSDESFVQMASSVLENPEELDKLRASNPQLAAAIEQNASKVQESWNSLDEDTKTFQTIQADNKKALTESGFSSDTMKNLGIDTEDLQASSYTELMTDYPGAVALFQQKDPAVSSNVNKVFAASPDVGKALAKATPADLIASGLNTPSGSKVYADYANQVDMVENLTEDTPVEVVLQSVGLDKSSLDVIIADAQAHAAFSGKPVPAELAAYQKAPSPKSALALAQSILRPGTKKELIKPADLKTQGGATARNLTVDGRLNGLKSDALTSGTKDFQEAFKKYLGDGEFSKEDMTSAASENLTGFFSMYQSGDVSDTIKQNAEPALKAAVNTKFTDSLTTYLDSEGQEKINGTWKTFSDARGGSQRAGSILSEFLGPTGGSQQLITELMARSGLPAGSEKFLSSDKKTEILKKAFKPMEDDALTSLRHELAATQARGTANSGYWGLGVELGRQSVAGLRALYAKTGDSAGLEEVNKLSAQLESAILTGESKAQADWDAQFGPNAKPKKERSGK